MKKIVWAAWGFLLAGGIAFLVRKLSLAEAIVIPWVLAFLLMWIVIWNLNVLPLRLLPVAVPWSFGEIAVAVLIARKVVGSTASEPGPAEEPSRAGGTHP